jgi:hypothetical protein
MKIFVWYNIIQVSKQSLLKYVFPSSVLPYCSTDLIFFPLFHVFVLMVNRATKDFTTSSVLPKVQNKLDFHVNILYDCDMFSRPFYNFVGKLSFLPCTYMRNHLPHSMGCIDTHLHMPPFNLLWCKVLLSGGWIWSWLFMSDWIWSLASKDDDD